MWLFLGINYRGKPNLMDMGSLMIKPVQRVMKYPLLLCELLNSTPVSHPDHKALQEALSTMKNINVNINELKRRKDLGKEKKKQWIFLSVWTGSYKRGFNSSHNATTVFAGITYVVQYTGFQQNNRCLNVTCPHAAMLPDKGRRFLEHENDKRIHVIPMFIISNAAANTNNN